MESKLTAFVPANNVSYKNIHDNAISIHVRRLSFRGNLTRFIFGPGCWFDGLTQTWRLSRYSTGVLSPRIRDNEEGEIFRDVIYEHVWNYLESPGSEK